MNLTLSWHSESHQGNHRPDNQDSVLADGHLFCVADGLGGHMGGATASSLGLKTLVQEINGNGSPSKDDLIRAIQSANKAILAAADQNPEELQGMGTTICTLVVKENQELLLANVGDSRAYSFRDGALTQISEDHNGAWELVKSQKITPEEAVSHPSQHYLLRALGTAPEVEVDVWDLEAPRDFQQFLLCTDGLTNEVSDAEIAKVLTGSSSMQDPKKACQDLVDMALAAGGKDNISVVLINISNPN